MRPYGLFTILLKFLRYYLRSKSKHAVHSPFVYKLITECLALRYKQDVTAIEQLRKRAKQNNELLTFKDYGQGGLEIQRSVSQVAKRSLKPRKYSELIAKIANYYKVNNALELGTSLGVTSAYIADNITGSLHTIEGAEEIAEIAQSHWKTLEIDNIHLHIGSFEEELSNADLPQFDLIFIDGHHQYEPTLAYFNQLLTSSHSGTLFVFDDIHWSVDMERAWSEIQKHPAVTTTIDLFFIGLVFLRPELSKEHFTVRY